MSRPREVRQPVFRGPPRRPHGLTLVELMLSLTITAIIAAAIAGMMGAVGSGIDTHRDARTTMVSANLASNRINAYIVPAQCVLDGGGDGLVIWLNDARESDTVHGTEIRWLLFEDGTLSVHWVRFPEGWARAAEDLEDREHPAGSDWMTVLSYYETRGWTASMPLIDNLDDVDIALDAADPKDAVHCIFTLTFDSHRGPMVVAFSAAIQLHDAPDA